MFFLIQFLKTWGIQSHDIFWLFTSFCFKRSKSSSSSRSRSLEGRQGAHPTGRTGGTGFLRPWGVRTMTVVRGDFMLYYVILFYVTFQLDHGHCFNGWCSRCKSKMMVSCNREKTSTNMNHEEWESTIISSWFIALLQTPWCLSLWFVSYYISLANFMCFSKPWSFNIKSPINW